MDINKLNEYQNYLNGLIVEINDISKKINALENQIEVFDELETRFCSKEQLEKQLEIMLEYKQVLIDRANYKLIKEA